MRELTEADVTFSLTAEPEDLEIEGNASAVDPETDAETYAWIRRELQSGNDWAWCCVTITATWEGIEGQDTLGGCSYQSENDFTNDGGEGYYSDMRKAALADLNENVRATIKLGSDLAALLSE